jgi:Uma2 family endonuclease
MDMLIEVPIGDRSDGLLTVDDVLRMDPSGRFRFELHEGVLRMTPPPAWKHQKAAARLERHFEDSGRDVCRENGIEFDDHNFRIPDVLVVKRDAVVDEDRSVHPPWMFDVVIEVVSPSSFDEDELVKSKVYAKAAIPEYWRVHLRPEGYVVVIGQLQGGRYVSVREIPLDELLAGGGGLV